MSKALPATFRKIVVQKISQNFREATQIVETKWVEPGKGSVTVKNHWVGINASDINYTAGRYDPSVKVPFDCGFEGVGEVVAVGPGCTSNVSVGQAVGYSAYGAFSEYTTLPENYALPIPVIRPELLSYLVSGLTAAISLEKVGEIRRGEKVLVTAAAGGTGQFAVQWAKAHGCHVIGTCSSDEKVEFLKSIGCDRPINYTKENFGKVMKEEYPKGVDVVYESIGGEMFETCVNSLAIRGRLITIGFITGYEKDAGFVPLKTSTPALISKLLTKSASVRGFFLMQYMRDYPEFLVKLLTLQKEGKLKPAYDNGQTSPQGPFKGLQAIPHAIDYLYSKKNVGKIVVDVRDTSSKL
ncbi:hypothetical protein CAPTEDRAFT_173764 [Capitella teleta]|uniref:15-oxoprostaglandin 13-reductase n=1 Tax=Capitella teleta TaxID=283909 RepID=R7UJX1_CAPTE|nr:hypothetical protein CAPTEDRAFT_173764 [Capitella teleta]|eukprot:ELU06398.1 hypothetical protein CAPTEDRAFT_173764 [Capitella teleta]